MVNKKLKSTKMKGCFTEIISWFAFNPNYHPELKTMGAKPWNDSELPFDEKACRRVKFNQPVKGTYCIIKVNNKYFLTILDGDMASYPYGIQEISRIQARKLFDSYKGDSEGYKPRGRFFAEDLGLYIGIDNSEGFAWTEEFDTLEECITWLLEG